MAKTVTGKEFIDLFSGFLIDAYGVLVQGGGRIDGALKFIDELNRQNKQFLIVSNDATHLKESTVEKYQNYGFSITADQVLTSGMMIEHYVKSESLQNANAIVFGPPESQELSRQAGLTLPPLNSTSDIDLLMICDERQENLIETLNWAASLILNSANADKTPKTVIANPDLLYPVQGGGFGFTAGSLGVMIQSWHQQAFGPNASEPITLGKPSAKIFKQALEMIDDKRPVMIGDQIQTDILGAKNAELPSCLSLMGLTQRLESWHVAEPDYVLANWSDL